MLVEKLRHRGWSWLAIWLLGLPCVGGCSDNSDSLKWTEDVLLADGRVVTLTRYQEFKGPHELSDTPTESDYWLEFKHPESQEVVRWSSDRDLATLALMMDKGMPLLLTTPNFGGASRRNCPNPPYLLFKYRDRSWTEVSLATIPVKQIRVNVTAWPKSRRALIRSSGNHLSTSQTQDSRYDGNRPYIIDFNRMTEQTFGNQNCGRSTDDLVR